MNVSIGEIDPTAITLKQAHQLVSEHIKELKSRVIANFEKEGIQVLNGRYGPYVTDGTTNASVPKSVDPKKLTLKDCVEMIEKKKAGKKKFA
jgi:DNA topoisomerase-1